MEEGLQGLLPGQVLQRVVEQIFGDFSASGTRFNSALRGAEPHGLGLEVPFSDVSVFRTASLGTWTLFLRARDLPTCHATVCGDSWKKFLEDFYVKVDTDFEVDLPVALGKLDVFLRAPCILPQMRQCRGF